MFRSNEVLEELFQVFNLSRPQDFEGHSLSVSDVSC
ncbi:MAG: YodL domain-containing protein [Lachnospiraceae bacterium]